MQGCERLDIVCIRHPAPPSRLLSSYTSYNTSSLPGRMDTGQRSNTTTINATPAMSDLIFTRRACRRTWASSAGSSIFSSFSPNWREPRADRPTQVLSRHWKKPEAAPQNSGSRINRHQRLAPRANKAARITRLIRNGMIPATNRLRRSAVLILGIQTAPPCGTSGIFIETLALHQGPNIISHG